MHYCRSIRFAQCNIPHLCQNLNRNTGFLPGIPVPQLTEGIQPPGFQAPVAHDRGGKTPAGTDLLYAFHHLDGIPVRIRILIGKLTTGIDSPGIQLAVCRQIYLCLSASPIPASESLADVIIIKSFYSEPTM